MIPRGNRATARRRQLRKSVSPKARLECASAFQILALECIADLEAQRNKASAGDAEAIHRMRVAITRLRAVVAFFAPMACDTAWLGLKKKIVGLHAALGVARDSAVIATYAERKHYRAWAKRARLAGSRCSSRDHRSLARCLRSAWFSRLVDELTSWVRSGTWPSTASQSPAQSLRIYGQEKLGRWRDRLLHKGRHFAKMGNARRHRCGSRPSDTDTCSKP
jgi:CHAD domain-containing protein